MERRAAELLQLAVQVHPHQLRAHVVAEEVLVVLVFEEILEGAHLGLLAEGDAPRNLTVKVHKASAAARKKIEEAGGRVEDLA